jgi:hypothetical protein
MKMVYNNYKKLKGFVYGKEIVLDDFEGNPRTTTARIPKVKVLGLIKCLHPCENFRYVQNVATSPHRGTTRLYKNNGGCPKIWNETGGHCLTEGYQLLLTYPGGFRNYVPGWCSWTMSKEWRRRHGWAEVK